VILSCNFEELRALASGAELLLEGERGSSTGMVAAPAEALVQVAVLLPRLNASLSIGSLSEQRWVRGAVGAICQNLHDRLDDKVVEYHPAHEEAVALYFDYAHAFAVLKRLDEMGVEMAGMIELITGARPTDQTAQSITFPD
jgi:hypothetical protein